jgi:Fe-S cluster biogenesis protein NfuA/nitrite reductase/ring-hydroxylating ferredoxin subunit
MTATSDATGTEPAADLDRAARRVDTAMERVELLDPAARKVATDLKAALEEFHREGLVRIVRALKADPRGKELLFGLVDDPVVYALLAMHGIVRADPTTLAQRALEEVRPYLESHGGGVALVEVELPVVRVRLSGACTGCSASATTLREVVERAVVAAVPGVHQVEVVPAEPARPVVPVGSIGLHPAATPAPITPAPITPAPITPAPIKTTALGEPVGWMPGPRLADVPDGRVSVWRPAGTSDAEPGVALVRIGGSVAAYKDACAHQGFSLERGMVDSEGGVLTCPWHGLKYQALTGESISMVGKRLQAYPARIDGDRLWLRLGG